VIEMLICWYHLDLLQEN